MVIVILAAALLGGCGQTGPGPIDAVDNYVGSVAEGDFTDACAALDNHAQAELAHYMRSGGGCAALLARCFPDVSTLLSQDQTQLLYGTVQISLHGRRGTALTGGTLVAKAVKEVNLIESMGQWELDSYGKEHCRRPTHRR
ncbi:MAG TPA: lipoprotein [Solirubrobacteraceae bacterium]|nr:lipoprotein [Solirubrobacteraceae bacterium]